MQHTTEAVLTDREASQYLRVSASYLQHARLKNEGPPFVRLAPRAIRYRQSDLDRFLRERLVETRSGGR